MKTLKEYCKEEGISYSAGYKRFREHKIQDSFVGADGHIYVGKVETLAEKQTNPIMFDNLPSTAESVDYMETAASTRTNKSAHVKLSDRYHHLENSPVPFSVTSSPGYKDGDVSVRDAIVLCQRAYWGFSIFRSTVELFTEFCVNNIYFKGGSKRARDFYELFFRKVGLNKLQDMFYRELWRSGNCFIYRFYGKLEGAEYKELARLFGGNTARTSVKIPIRYILLNPADIQAQGSITFNQPTYLQVLSDYELERLRNPRTPQDQEVLDSLSPEDREKIKGKGRDRFSIYRQLDTKDIVAIFLSKQSYEAFSVPLGFGVLEHLNHKKELENMDQAISRTVQQAVLLVTTGAEPDKGGINYKNIENLRKIFENESIGRTLVADYTTKVEFKIPQIGDILDPKKYTELNQSIAIGLGNVFLIQGEKFANQSAKIDLFIQRLHGARRLFLEEFLIPEMKYLASELGFKGDLPQPFYEELDLKNEVEYAKIYTRLMELGLLTVDEGLTAIETGKLPTKEDSLEAQKEYKQARDQELYKPLLAKEPKEEEGRKKGSSMPNQKKTVGPIGGSILTNFSLSSIRDNMLVAQKLEDKVRNDIKVKHSLQSLTPEQETVVSDLTVSIMRNEGKDYWLSKVDQYMEYLEVGETPQSKQIDEICQEYGVDSYLGSILFFSKV